MVCGEVQRHQIVLEHEGRTQWRFYLNAESYYKSALRQSKFYFWVTWDSCFRKIVVITTRELLIETPRNTEIYFERRILHVLRTGRIPSSSSMQPHPDTGTRRQHLQAVNPFFVSLVLNKSQVWSHCFRTVASILCHASPLDRQ